MTSDSESFGRDLCSHLITETNTADHHNFLKEESFDESIHQQLNETLSSVRLEPHSSFRSHTLPSEGTVPIINPPPPSKWLSLNHALRARGIHDVPLVLTASDTMPVAALDASALLSACDQLLHSSRRVTPRSSDAESLEHKVTVLEKHLRETKEQLSTLQRHPAFKDRDMSRSQRTLPPTDSKRTSELQQALAEAHTSIAQLREKVAESEKARSSDLTQSDRHIAELQETLAHERLRFRKFEQERRELIDEHDKVVMHYMKTVGTLKEQLEAKQKELDIRPTNKAFDDVRAELWKLQEVARKKVMARRGHGDVRMLMQRDKLAHKMGLNEAVLLMDEDELRDLVKDICVILGVKDIQDVLDVVRDKVALRPLESLPETVIEQVFKENAQPELEVVKHYMELFAISELKHVMPAMNAQSRRMNELHNFWKAVCSELGLDFKTVTVNKCLQLLGGRLKTP